MAVDQPTTKKWTHDDLLALPDEGARYELIDGELYELPMPNEPHQRASRNLIILLLPAATQDGAEWYHAPTRVYLPPDGERGVEPDLLYFFPDGNTSRSYRGIEGALDLVVEILSPSNPEHDEEDKRTWYAQAGVREYWIVSPEFRAVEVLVLEGGEYQTLVLARGEDPVTSTVFTELRFPAAAIFA